jgi:hypothetical protein
MEMHRPIVEQPLPVAWGMGSHLQIGIAAKAGQDWAETTDLPVTGFSPEWEPLPMEQEDEEDWAELRRVV